MEFFFLWFEDPSKSAAMWPDVGEGRRQRLLPASEWTHGVQSGTCKVFHQQIKRKIVELQDSKIKQW